MKLELKDPSFYSRCSERLVELMGSHMALCMCFTLLCGHTSQIKVALVPVQALARHDSVQFASGIHAAFLPS